MSLDPFEVLISYVNDDKRYGVSDLLWANRKVEAPIGDDLILKLKNRFLELPFSEWPPFMVAFVEIFNKATTEDTKIECLKIIISADRNLIFNDADRSMGWTTKAKEKAINYLSTINSHNALKAIASGLSDYYVSCDAANELIKSEYGLGLFLDFLNANQLPDQSVINILLNKESDQIVNTLLDMLDKNPSVSKILINHKSESVNSKAKFVLNILQEKEESRRKETAPLKPKTPLGKIEVVKYQIKKDPMITKEKGRKKYKFLRRQIRETSDGDAYFKCPFCGERNEVYSYYCEHVVYGFETVNNSEIYRDDDFYIFLMKLISSDPSKYIEDFEYVLDDYASNLETKDESKTFIDLAGLGEILNDKISPDVIEAIFAANGIPVGIKSIVEYSLVNFYIGGGTYFYLISDDDLETLSKQKEDTKRH